MNLLSGVGGLDSFSQMYVKLNKQFWSFIAGPSSKSSTNSAQASFPFALFGSPSAQGTKLKVELTSVHLHSPPTLWAPVHHRRGPRTGKKWKTWSQICKNKQLPTSSDQCPLHIEKVPLGLRFDGNQPISHRMAGFPRFFKSLPCSSKGITWVPELHFTNWGTESEEMAAGRRYKQWEHFT
jgi:hypothetical protein